MTEEYRWKKVENWWDYTNSNDGRFLFSIRPSNNHASSWMFTCQGPDHPNFEAKTLAEAQEKALVLFCSLRMEL